MWNNLLGDIGADYFFEAQTMLSVIAFHGDLATPEMLRRDMGDPQWVTEYACLRDLDRGISLFADLFREPSIVVGYSSGGELCAILAGLGANIVGAVVYEAPVPRDMREVPGDFPVIQIWNDYRPRLLLRRLRKANAQDAWSARHQVWHRTGSFRSHIHRYLDGSYGHAWDQALNPGIASWIEARKKESTSAKIEDTNSSVG